MTGQTPAGSAPLPEIVVRRLAAIAVTALILGGLLIAVAVLVAVYGDINKGELVAILASVGVLLNIASGCTGGLGAILASTRAVDPGPPGSVTVTPSPATADTPAATAAGVTVTAAPVVPPPPPPPPRHRPPTKRTPAKKTSARRHRGQAGDARPDLVVATIAIVVALWLLTLAF